MKRNRMTFVATGAMALLFLLTIGAPNASADIGFDLINGNTALSPYVGPYAHVNVHLTDATHATITFTSLTNSGNIYLLGDGSSAAVNVNATSFSASFDTCSNAGTGFGSCTPVSTNIGSNNVSQFGNFNLAFDSFDGFGHSSDLFRFTVTNTSSSWGSEANVLIANDNGSTAAAHIFVTSSPANKKNGAVVTGFASDGTAVPDGGLTLLLLGGALFGLETLRRFRA